MAERCLVFWPARIVATLPVMLSRRMDDGGIVPIELLRLSQLVFDRWRRISLAFDCHPSPQEEAVARPSPRGLRMDDEAPYSMSPALILEPTR